MALLEIAGTIISGISLIKDLREKYNDLNEWDSVDLQVDRQWLDAALENEVLPGTTDDYVWARLDSVPTKELKRTHTVVTAHNDNKKTIYRIVRGKPDDLIVLMKRA